jgi:heat shock protein HslJ
MHRSLAVCCLLTLAACQSIRPDPQTQVNRIAGTSWMLDSVGGVPTAPGVDSTLEIDGQGEVVGRGGCNPYVSGLSIEGTSLRFDKVMAAEVNCSDEQISQEERFFSALAATRTTRIEHGRLILLDASGKVLARLKRRTLFTKNM